MSLIRRVIEPTPRADPPVAADDDAEARIRAARRLTQQQRRLMALDERIDTQRGGK
jgi:hypothetical protein